MKLTNLTLTTPYLSLDPIFYHEVTSTPLKNPRLISHNPPAAELIGLDPSRLNAKELEELLNGTLLLEGSRPYAMCYAGHQFGYYVQRLGDGRAINLGMTNGWNLQLKGSGQTLYSRQGDGRAVLRSSIREYLMSEAIDAAEKNDFTLMNDLLTLAQNPYDEHERFERYAQPTPHACKNLKLSCSS